MRKSVSEKIKIQFSVDGVLFVLPVKKTRISPTKINLERADLSKVFKQYVKTKFEDVVVSVSSQSFSGGDSCDIYVCNQDGSPIEDWKVKQITSFVNRFHSNSYNYWNDCQEHIETDVKTDRGTIIGGDIKYIFVNNQPKHGTYQSCINAMKSLLDGTTVMGKLTELNQCEKELSRWGYKTDFIHSAWSLLTSK